MKLAEICATNNGSRSITRIQVGREVGKEVRYGVL